MTNLKEAKNLSEREILTSLVSDGFKLSEALEVCKSEFSDRAEKFTEAAFDIKIDSLPKSGYIRQDGVTVVTGEWED